MNQEAKDYIFINMVELIFCIVFIVSTITYAAAQAKMYLRDFNSWRVINWALFYITITLFAANLFSYIGRIW
jgi:hypothetical protein